MESARISCALPITSTPESPADVLWSRPKTNTRVNNRSSMAFFKGTPASTSLTAGHAQTGSQSRIRATSAASGVAASSDFPQIRMVLPTPGPITRLSVAAGKEATVPHGRVVPGCPVVSATRSLFAAAVFNRGTQISIPMAFRYSLRRAGFTNFPRSLCWPHSAAFAAASTSSSDVGSSIGAVRVALSPDRNSRKQGR